MKQQKIIVQDGKVRLEEADLPTVPPNHLCVRMEFTGISTGTELMMLDQSRAHSTKMDLGYQGSGIVEKVGEGLESLYKVGDPATCNGGPYVHHASVLNVPKHLVTKLASADLLRSAAFPTLCAVALHGFRSCEARLGETVAIIGQGLLGNMTAQVANAAGCRVAASEQLPLRIALSKKCGVNVVETFNQMRTEVSAASDDHGADGVILATANSNDDLLDFGFELVRRLGRIVVLGLCDAKLPRNLMFKKEASIVVSRASGWGRYDANYEMHGADLPYEHARWTEHRNLAEVARLLAVGKLQTLPLITDEIIPHDAASAYEFLQNSPEDHLGVVIRWNR